MEDVKKINDLPIEVLIRIFEKLYLSDLQAASLVCKYWYDITTLKKFQSKILINIWNTNECEIELKDETEPAKLFLNSNRKFYNIKINIYSIEFNNCFKFFDKIGETIQSLELGEQLKISPDILFKILNTIKIPLKELILVENIVLKENDENFLSEFSNYCDNNTNNVLSKLEKLDINFSNLESYNSNNLFTNPIFMKLLLKNNLTLKSITLNNSQIKNFENFLNIWQTIKLEELNFNYTFRCEWENYKDVVFMQKSVKILNLSNFNNIPIEDLYNLANNSKYITKLTPYFGTNDENDNLKYLLEMKNLKNYDITHTSFDNITPIGIVELFGQKLNNKIEELQLGSRIFPDDQLQKCILCYPNLIDLNISVNYIHYDQVSILTDNSIQLIIKHLKLLKYLNLQGHKLITDYALTGIDVNTNEKTGVSIDQLKGLLSLNLDGCEKLTDFTLINSIKFIELRTIILQENNNYTSEGLEFVVKNCPSIEKLIYTSNSWNYLDVLKKIIRLKIFNKICKKCSEAAICHVKSFNFDEILQPHCYRSCKPPRIIPKPTICWFPPPRLA